DVLRRHFRQHFDDAQAGRIRQEHHRRVLDYWCEKHRLNGDRDWEQLVPSDLRRHVEGRLRHETVVSDDFNRSDGSLGSSSEGWSWAEVAGSWSIASNVATQSTTASAGAARAEFDLSSDDHESSVDIV